VRQVVLDGVLGRGGRGGAGGKRERGRSGQECEQSSHGVTPRNGRKAKVLPLPERHGRYNLRRSSSRRDQGPIGTRGASPSHETSRPPTIRAFRFSKGQIHSSTLPSGEGAKCFRSGIPQAIVTASAGMFSISRFSFTAWSTASGRFRRWGWRTC